MRLRPTPGARSLALGLALGTVIACLPWSPGPPEGHHRTQPVEGAGAEIGSDACYACHDSFEGHFVASDHHKGCESCHGAGELHAYTARASDVRFPASADCIACHERGSHDLFGWAGSIHARADVSCSDCHDTHNRELWNLRPPPPAQAAAMRNATAASQLCLGCHPGVRAQLDLPSHHPVVEGMVGCTDCHHPHRDARESRAARISRCEGCHQEVVGPWIFEHAPVAEDCGHCHVPHGASADALLEASQPAACISCHSIPIAGAVHQPFAFSTACTDCHSAVHGSYSDPHLRQ